MSLILNIRIIFITIILITISFSCNNKKDIPKAKKIMIEYRKLQRVKNLYRYRESKKLFTGTAKSTYKTGKKHKELNFKNGKLDGVSMVWYPNGQKKSITNYKLDRRDGKYITWYPNGQKQFEIDHKDGKLNGLYQEWDTKGKLIARVTYKNGRKIKNSTDIIKEMDPKTAAAIKEVRDIDEKEAIDIQKMEKLRKELKIKKEMLKLEEVK